METKTISVCKRTRRSLWANKTNRHTDEGMKEVVIHEMAGGKKTSKTMYVKG